MDPGISITRGGLERIDELEPLWAALHEHHSEFAPPLAGLRVRSTAESWTSRRAKYEQALRDPDAFVLIAERSGGAVGYALVSFGEGGTGWVLGDRVGDVETLSVLPAVRGHGVGAALMRAVETELARLGVTEIRVRVLASNAEALRFYERLGLTPVAQVLLGRVAPPRAEVDQDPS